MTLLEIAVPDLGGLKDAPVLELLVRPGDEVQEQDPLLLLESDKATIEVPAPRRGIVRELRVGVGARVSQGTPILMLEPAGADSATSEPLALAPSARSGPPLESKAPPVAEAAASARNDLQSPTQDKAADQVREEPGSAGFTGAHASPSVRNFARELGVDLLRVSGTGPRGRILQGDVQAFVKRALAIGSVPGAAAQDGGLGLLPWPKVDFAAFGPVERRPLSRIRKVSGANLARNWVMIPHVTQFDEADVTELEAFRVEVNRELSKAGVKLTLLAFLMRAAAAALREFPEFCASLEGDQLVLKSYYHIGFAADTPNGLVVPVVRDVDRKGLAELARESAELAEKARTGKLGGAEMQGGCFTISSLGGIGGTAFTPIINAPEVAILGVSRSVTKPVWNGTEFIPRLMLPLSLSYDHRVIDGAAAARFTGYLARLLSDMRRALL
jgi:pyruvate dehydrogenase E2 component (dihydrolipoamide acetyltransferase)